MRKVLGTALLMLVSFSCGTEVSSLYSYEQQGQQQASQQPFTSQSSSGEQNQTIDKTLPFLGLVIPAYYYDETLWDKTVGLPAKAYVIVNPDSGPGSQYDPAYADFITSLNNSGKIPVGYVHTSWGGRPLNDVEKDVDTWLNFYPDIKGFFIDEVSDASKEIPYYQELADYIKSKGNFKIILNPGTVPDSGYFNLADLVVTYEDSKADLSQIGYSGNPSKSVCMVYGVPQKDLKTVEGEIKGYCQWIYITDDTVPNPYDSLPSYADEEAGDVGG